MPNLRLPVRIQFKRVKSRVPEPTVKLEFLSMTASETGWISLTRKFSMFPSPRHRYRVCTELEPEELEETVSRPGGTRRRLRAESASG